MVWGIVGAERPYGWAFKLGGQESPSIIRGILG